MTTTQSTTAPPAFRCAASRYVMTDPVLGLCGHLFEKTVADGLMTCPIDNHSLQRRIPLAELKAEIAAWKAFSGPPSYLQAASSSLHKKHIPPIRIVKNAHFDDIHGFLQIAPELFVSGSKDNSLKMWNTEGALIKGLKGVDRGYKYWVTALGKLSCDKWASGTRDGVITIWNNEGKEISTFQNKDVGATHKCKQRNSMRINCLTELENGLLYAGTPRYIRLFSTETGDLLDQYEAARNDWVYCIEVVEFRNLLVVIGSDLEFWNMQNAEIQKSRLIREEYRQGQRPHISAITRLEQNKNLLSNALFDGSVKIVDIVAQRTVKTYQEHTGRVWAVMNLGPHLFASSADDRTIKIWDVRQRPSCLTIKGNPGRVSSLLRLSENTFISGSCPDNVLVSEEKASITFWDIRQIKERIT